MGYGPGRLEVEVAAGGVAEAEGVAGGFAGFQPAAGQLGLHAVSDCGLAAGLVGVGVEGGREGVDVAVEVRAVAPFGAAGLRLLGEFEFEGPGALVGCRGAPGHEDSFEVEEGDRRFVYLPRRDVGVGIVSADIEWSGGPRDAGSGEFQFQRLDLLLFLCHKDNPSCHLVSWSVDVLRISID